MKDRKLLYIAPTKIEINQLDGVAKKILGHVKVFNKEYNVSLLFRDAYNVVLYQANKNEFIKLGTGKNRNDILRAAFNIIEEKEYDYCYIRYPNTDLLFLSLLKRMKKKRIRVVVEIPTYPYDAEGLDSLKGIIVHMIDRICRKQLKKYVDRIITYSEDEKIFGIKTIRTINGLDFEQVRLSNVSKRNGTIHLCGVATFHRIHGYDRLIYGMQKYYSNGGMRDIVFDIVGYGDNTILHEYKEIVKQSGLKDRVIFHGRLSGTDLDNVYDKASIGVNSLAIHRQNLERESTLKTREYAAKGLPILSSSYIDAFSDNDNDRFVCIVPADESPIDINRVIEFYDDLVEHIDIEHLKQVIRENASKFCDMPVTLRPIISYLDNSSKCCVED